MASLRILFLATYFPKPGNALMGIWAASMADGLRRQGASVVVLSPTSWVPRVLGRPAFRNLIGSAGAWARCPPESQWRDLPVFYPRWPKYHRGPHVAWSYRSPEPELAAAWSVSRQQILRIVEQTNPDVIYAHHLSVSGYVAHRLQMELGIPYVTHDHAFEEITDCDHYPARRGMYRKIGGGAETMIAVSTRMASDLARIVPGKSVRVVHTGADAPPIALSEVPRPRHLRNKTIVFSAAGFYRRKGVPLLIEAFARATSNNAHAVLRIAGDGADRPAVEQAITNSGISERIDLLGFISHAQVLQEMAWADVFALIGWDEPFATVFSEAMAAGSPIITAADGGITDVVCDGVHGRIVAPRDLVSAAEAVRELIENEDQRKRMGDAARTLFSTHLTWDGQACAALSILQDAAIVGRERNLTDSPRYGLGVVTSAHHRAADEQTGRKRH